MMAFVQFQNRAFIGGQRFDAGIQQVDESLLDILPSSAEVLDDGEAKAELARQVDPKADQPKTLKQAAAGENTRKPMGKEKAKPSGDDLKALRDEYKAAHPDGKGAFNGWDADTLRAKIEGLKAGGE